MESDYQLGTYILHYMTAME